MKTSSTRVPDMLARLRGVLRGNRHTADAHQTTPVDGAPHPARSPVAAPEATAEER